MKPKPHLFGSGGRSGRKAFCCKVAAGQFRVGRLPVCPARLLATRMTRHMTQKLSALVVFSVREGFALLVSATGLPWSVAVAPCAL